MIPGAKLSYDLKINDRNGKAKAVRVKIEEPGDPSGAWKGGGGAVSGGKGLARLREAKEVTGMGPTAPPQPLATRL